MLKTWVFLFSYFMFLDKQRETSSATRAWKSKLWKTPRKLAPHTFNGIKKLLRTLSFSKSRPCSSHEPSSTMHNDERRKKKIMNWVLPIKTLISPNCVAVWLSACLLICDLSANWITFKAHQVQFALTAWSDSSVHPAVLIIQAHVLSASPLWLMRTEFGYAFQEPNSNRAEKWRLLLNRDSKINFE